jgi:hypothetical protein
MTWSRVVASGRGPFALRLVIEGWPHEFCEAGLTLGVKSDDRERVGGLLRDGIRFEERGRLIDGIPDVSSFRVTIVDIDGKATTSFTTRPSVRQYLNEPVTYDEEEFDVLSTTPFTVDDYYHMGTEVFQVDAIPTGTEIEVVRGQWDTTAQAQSSTVGANKSYVEITDVPTMMTGRRYWIYAHGPDEVALTDSGTEIWAGVIKDEPMTDDMVTWTISCGPLTDVLDQELGAEMEDPFLLRGIYYAYNSPLVLEIEERTGGSWTSALDEIFTVSVTGFYETHEAFAAILQAAITSESTENTYTVRYDDRKWWIEVTTPGSAYYALCRIPGLTRGHGFAMGGAPHSLDTGEFVANVASGTTYRFVPSDDFSSGGETFRYMSHFEIPRASYVPNSFEAHHVASTSAPGNRLYLNDGGKISTSTVLAWSWDPGWNSSSPSLENAQPRYRHATVDTVSSSSGYIDVTVFASTQELDTDIGHARDRFGSHPEFVAYNNLGSDVGVDTFIDNVVSAGDDDTTGTIPLLRSDEVADWSTVAAAAADGILHLTSRGYRFRKPVKLREVLEQELRILGCYMFINGSNELDIRHLIQEANTATSSTTVDNDDFVVTGGFGAVQHNPDGIVNVVEIDHLWDFREEKFLRAPIRVRDVRSVSRLRRTRTLKMASEVEAPPLDIEEATRIAAPALTMFSERYTIMTVPVTLKSFDVLVGDPIVINLQHIVPYDGGRGMNRTGTVIGRRWDIANGMGELEVMILGVNLAGYAPTMRVSSTSGSGTAWTLTVEASRYAPTGTDDVDWFEVGDKIAVIQLDDASLTTVTGTIDSISGYDVAITFDATYTPGGLVWNVISQDHGSATTAQREFAFIADSGALLSTDEPAQVFI